MLLQNLDCRREPHWRRQLLFGIPGGVPLASAAEERLQPVCAELLELVRRPLCQLHPALGQLQFPLLRLALQREPAIGHLQLQPFASRPRVLEREERVLTLVLQVYAFAFVAVLICQSGYVKFQNMRHSYAPLPAAEDPPAPSLFAGYKLAVLLADTSAFLAVLELAVRSAARSSSEYASTAAGLELLSVLGGAFLYQVVRSRRACSICRRLSFSATDAESAYTTECAPRPTSAPSVYMQQSRSCESYSRFEFSF